METKIQFGVDRENIEHPTSNIQHPSGERTARRVEMLPINSETLRERVKLASAWDGHPNMLLPTHCMRKGDDIVGCTSLGACLFAHTWLHTEKLRGFDAVRAMRDIELVARSVGWQGMVVVSPPDSGPFRHMADFGYQNLGNLSLWFKGLQPKE